MTFNRPTEDQKSLNTVVLNNFMFAMMNMDLNGVDYFLEDKGLFLNRLNKWQFLFWLKKKFDKVPMENFGSSIEDFISTDYYAGNIGFCFKYAESNADGMRETIVSVRLVLEIKSGKIWAARVPRSYIPVKQKGKYAAQN